MNWQKSRLFVLAIVYCFNDLSSAYDWKTLVRDTGAKACPDANFCYTNA